MKDEETGLEIYGVPNAETRAAMKEAARNHRANFSGAEKLFASIENGILKAFVTHWGDNSGVVYSTREEAMRNCKDGQFVSEIELKICSVQPAFMASQLTD